MSGFFNPKRLFVLLFFVGMILVSCLSGLGLSHISPSIAQSVPPSVTTTDIVPSSFLAAQDTYLKRCSTCHLAIPPAVLPRQTWSIMLRDQNHYGVILDPILEPDFSRLTQYFLRYSRALKPEEAIPYRIATSRYFKVLHPRVTLEQTSRLNTCITCHPQAKDFNFRALSDEWINAS